MLRLGLSLRNAARRASGSFGSCSVFPRLSTLADQEAAVAEQIGQRVTEASMGENETLEQNLSAQFP